MTVLKKTIAAAAALAFVGAPMAASAAPAGSPARVAAPVSGKSSKLAGGFVAPLFAVVALGLGIGIAAGGKNKPKSP